MTIVTLHYVCSFAKSGFTDDVIGMACNALLLCLRFCCVVTTGAGLSDLKGFMRLAGFLTSQAVRAAQDEGAHRTGGPTLIRHLATPRASTPRGQWRTFDGWDRDKFMNMMLNMIRSVSMRAHAHVHTPPHAQAHAHAKECERKFEQRKDHELADARCV